MNQRNPTHAVGNDRLSESRSLDQTLFHGIAWTAIFRWMAQIVSWAIMLYVARVLSPDDFGIVAMATIPIGLARLVEDIGLDAVIVQNRDLNEEQLAQLGGFAMGVGMLLTLIFLALAYPIASFFKEPAVAGLVAILSLTFILDALQILPRALLQRDLAFRRLAWINGLQMVIAAMALGIYAASGFSYWSLALNTLTSAVVTTAVLLMLRPHRLAWPGQLAVLWPSLKSGWRLLVSRGAWYGYSNLDQTIIGRMLGKAELGAYSFAMTFARIPLDEVSSLVGKVVPGVFSAVQHDKEKLRRYFLMLTEATCYISFPMAIGLLLTADDFIHLALGSQWEAVITPLRILCLYAVVYAAQSLTGHVLLWTGHFRVNMYLNLFALLVLPIGYLIGAHWGLQGVAWGLAVGFPVTIIPALYCIRAVLAMPVSEWFAALRAPLIACTLMAVSVLTVRYFLTQEQSFGFRLAVQSVSGAFTYLLVILTLYRARLNTIWRAIRGR